MMWWRHFRRRELVYALPDEIVQVLAQFLVGVDIFALSHVNRSFYRQLSGEDVWATLHRPWFPPRQEDTCDPVMPHCWQKQAYAQSRCIVLTPRAPKWYVCSYDFGASLRHSYITDVWFCVLPEFIEKQRKKVSLTTVNVHCSIDKNHTVSVAPYRWEHLAWVLSGRSETVFLNGQVVFRYSPRHKEHHFELGSELRSNFFGFPRAQADASKQNVDFVFYCLMHTMRRRSLISTDQIHHLTDLDDYGVVDSKVQVLYDEHGRANRGGLCSQPHEEVGSVWSSSTYHPRNKVKWWNWRQRRKDAAKNPARYSYAVMRMQRGEMY